MAEWKTNASAPTSETIDRRQRRSVNPMEALDLQLRYVKERLGLSALVLCDDLGEVLACSGEESSVEELALQTPWLFATPEWEFQSALAFLWQSFPNLKRHNISLTALDVPGAEEGTLFLAGVGESSYLDAWVEHAAAGVKRIISTMIN